MSKALLLLRILLPQLWRFALPGLGNVWMAMIKATALISGIQLPELLRNADIVARGFAVYEICIIAGILYLIVTYGILFIFQKVERRLSGHLRDRPEEGAAAEAWTVRRPRPYSA